MSDNPAPSQGVSLSIIDTWKLKVPSVYIALPPPFINHIGGIVIAWGMFETAFEDFLTAMLLETGSTYKGWQFFSFEQKREIFKTELAACFKDCPNLFDRLTALLDDATTTQRKRNLLVHGQIILRLGEAKPLIVARGEYKRQQVTETFSEDQTDDLYYEILHLAGRMSQAVRADQMEFGPPLPLPEKSRLLAVLSKNQNVRSNPTMLLPPPQSSGA